MFKTLIAAAALSFAFAGVAAAEDMKKCDDETMAMVMKAVEGAPEEAMKKGMMEFDMAEKAAMAK